MKIFSALLVAALLGSTTAFATDVTVDCKALSMAGNSATIKGVLQVTEQGQEYPAVQGVLHVLIAGSIATPVLDADVKVSGARLDDGSMSLAATEDQTIGMIYINPKDKDLSAVEKDGNQYLSNCKQ